MGRKMKTSWKQIYPRDCYRVLLKMSGETGISFPKIVNIVIREGLIRLGKLPEETSLAHLLQPTPINQDKNKTEKKPIPDEELEEFYASEIKNWPDYDLTSRIITLQGALGWLKERPHLKNPQKILEIADPREVQAVKDAMTKYTSLQEIINKAIEQIKTKDN